MTSVRVRLATLSAAACVAIGLLGTPAAASPGLWFDTSAAAAISTEGTEFVDGYGREVVLRGFNVSGEEKLEENGGLPFASVADAQASATALRRLAGSNAVRFPLNWAHIQPAPNQVDTGYLAAATAQLAAFLDQGIEVFPDFHQDLYSRYLFNQGSWYTGDGAPQWVVAAGGYPREFCGICVNWGQNITQNAAVQDATADFWHDRVLSTSAGSIGVQDAFLAQAQQTMTYLKQHLTGAEFTRIVGVDPFNEPYAGTYDTGQNSQSWEQTVLWPFYQKFRQRMNAAGWTDKPAFVEPNLFWNANISFEQQPGGLAVGQFGPGFAFNTHFYDEQALSGILMLGNATDGQYLSDFNTIRQRATGTNSPAFVSEFGNPVTGSVSGKTPSVLKAMYQALDSSVSGAGWWTQAASSGPVLSATQWQWDVYNGRHHELMNGNPDKVQTSGDGWNGEDFSAVDLTANGTAQLREDANLLDRIYPAAVAGTTLAFTYEDRATDSGTTLTWNPIPSSMPNLARLVGSGQYGVLVWRGNGGPAPTELNLPATFTANTTTVLSDLGASTGIPAYTAHGQTADHAIAIAPQVGDSGAQRLILSPPPNDSGVPHYALITNGSPVPSASLTAAAAGELANWAATTHWNAA
jgi:hypothetical protein